MANASRIPLSELPTGRLSRLKPHLREGLFSACLVIAYATIAGYIVDQAKIPELLISCTLIALLGALFGVMLGMWRRWDTLAQSAGILVGVSIVVAIVLRHGQTLADGYWHRFLPFGRYLYNWYTRSDTSAENERLLLSLLAGMVVWLVAFFSAWSLTRRGWILPALIMPAAIAFGAHVTRDGAALWPVLTMVGLGVMLATSHHMNLQRRRWAARQIASPVGLPQRVIAAGLVLTLLATSAGVLTPGAWANRLVDPALERVGQTWQDFSDWSNRTMSRFGLGSAPAGPEIESYNAFGDGFQVSGPIRLTDQPMVLVRTDALTAPYLTAHSYDEYTGRGWVSSTEQTFDQVDANGRRMSPELRFAPQQEVVLSPSMTNARVRQETQITSLTEQQDVVFSVGTYITANQQSIVRMSWETLDGAPFTLDGSTLVSLPPGLQRIASLLIQSDLRGEAGDQGPMPTSPSLATNLREEVDRLSGQNVQVRWEASDDGIGQTLYVTGQLPVYDDVESVYPGAGSQGTYEVTSLVSVASEPVLIDASTNYPAWVTDRYLQTGDTVTARTIELTRSIVGEETNPYVQAKLVEEYLRSSITYDLEVDAPPDGYDLVDYVLFENPRGYCEHYASAMTVMMRTLGVPARTVVGYYPGDRDEQQNGFLYREQNAHAWTEVYFPEYGWIPFEPTSNRPLQDLAAPVEQQQQDAQPTVTPEPTVAVPTPDTQDDNAAATPVPDANQDVVPPQTTALPDSGDSMAIPRWVAPLTMLAALFAALAGLVWFGWHRQLNNLAPTSSLFRRLERVGRMVGTPNASTKTAREFGRSLETRIPAGAQQVRDIVRVYEDDQYSATGAMEQDVNAATASWRRLRGLVPARMVRRGTTPQRRRR